MISPEVLEKEKNITVNDGHSGRKSANLPLTQIEDSHCAKRSHCQK